MSYFGIYTCKMSWGSFLKSFWEPGMSNICSFNEGLCPNTIIKYGPKPFNNMDMLCVVLNLQAYPKPKTCASQIFFFPSQMKSRYIKSLFIYY